MKHERRYQAGRPYYRPRSKHQVSAESDYFFTLLLAVFVGGLIGATVMLGAVTTGMVSL